MTKNISKIYLNEEQNLQFNDFYLKEILANTNNAESIPSATFFNTTLEKLLGKLLKDEQTKSKT